MKLLVTVLLAAFAASVAVAAEEKPLQPFDRQELAGETRCLPLFVATTFGGTTSEQIIFSYDADDETAKRDTVPKLRVLVRISNRAPTYEKVSVDGQDGVLFRLSQEEYTKAAACLPKPEK